MTQVNYIFNQLQFIDHNTREHCNRSWWPEFQSKHSPYSTLSARAAPLATVDLHTLKQSGEVFAVPPTRLAAVSYRSPLVWKRYRS